MLSAGTYKATLTSHAISETKSGDPQAVIRFSVATDTGSHALTWFGSFKEKAQPITLKALITCGLVGNNPAGPLEVGKELSIVVSAEIDDSGKERNKIQWINSLGEIKKVIPQDLAKAKLSSLEGAVMLARSKFGSIKNHDSDEIPF